jgi:hypothetical protein
VEEADCGKKKLTNWKVLGQEMKSLQAELFETVE